MDESSATVSSTQNDLVDTCKSCTKLQSRLERALRQLERQLTFGEEVRGENEKLKQQLQDLKQQNRLGGYKKYSSKRLAVTTSSTQTESSVDDYTQTTYNSGSSDQISCPSISAAASVNNSISCSSGSGDPALQAAATGGEQSGEQSVADMLRDAANECLSHNGYVYDEKSGLYYDYSSGYYYDPHRRLFYEPRSGTYYAYNEETREYRLHSREDPERLKKHCERLWIQTGGQHAPPPRKRMKRNAEQHQRPESSTDRQASSGVADDDVINSSTSAVTPLPSEAGENGDQCVEEEYAVEEEEEEEEEEQEDDGEEEDDLEDGEITGDSDEEDLRPSESGGTTADRIEEEKVEEEEEEEMQEEEEQINDGEAYAPCVRLMVTASEGMPVGSLFIVTCNGGTIGRSSNRYKHAVTLEGDGAVAECHCEISYDSAAIAYEIRVANKSSPIKVNGENLRQRDGAIPLHHGYRLDVGDTELAVHIHPGSDTCDECEPGLARANARVVAAAETETAVSSSSSREDQRRNEMRRLKSKFGLRGASFEPVKVRGRDRAAERRIEKGSEGPSVTSAGAAVQEGTSAHRHLPDSNRGARLLAKMGWRPGQSLGRTGSSGIVEPVTAEVRLDPQAGLGSALPTVSLDAGSDPSRLARIRNWQKMRNRYSRLEQQSQAAGGSDAQ